MSRYDRKISVKFVYDKLWQPANPGKHHCTNIFIGKDGTALEEYPLIGSQGDYIELVRVLLLLTAMLIRLYPVTSILYRLIIPGN